MTDQPIDTKSPAGRRWRRSKLTVPVRITLEKSKELNVIHTRGSEVNDGGIAVLADTELPIGEQAEFKFTPPHFYPFVTVRGIIRNRVDGVYGVEFLATSPAEAKQLELFRHILARWNT